MPDVAGRDQQIWRAVAALPRGKVATYGGVAAGVTPPCNPRLVAVALRRAPAALRLPWHRVVAAGGRIALPGAAGLEQRLRLEAEGVMFRGSRVDLQRHHCKPAPRSRTTPSSGHGHGKIASRYRRTL